MSSLVKKNTGNGDVSSSGGSTDNAIVRFDGTSGDAIQNSSVTISDAGNMDLGGGKITSLGTPTASTDAVTKAYADAIASGLSPKVSCVVATTANLSTTYSGTPNFKLTATSNGAISIDGVSLSLNDRVLVKNQSTASQNGIYYVSTVGDGSNPYVLTRATDFDQSSETLSGTYTFITSGSTNAATGFILTTTGTITLDTTSLTFTQFSTATAYIAGDGLTLSTLTFAVGAGTGILVSADSIAVDTTLVATTTNALTMSNKTLTSPVLTTPSVTGGTTGSILFYGSSSVISQDNSNLFWDDTKNFLGVGLATPVATVDILQAAASTGSPIMTKFTGGAHTTLTASTEANDVYLNLTRTVQFSTGALTTQRAVYITAPTYGFVGASTLSTAATFCVSNAPIAGTNATITRAYSIMSENGNVCFTMSSNAALTIDFLGANSTGSSRTVTFKSALTAGSASTDFTLASTGTTRTTGNLFDVVNNATTKFSVAFSGLTTITQSALTSGSPNAFIITGGAHTTLTAATEASDILLNLNRTVQLNGGDYALQRAIVIQAPVYGFTSATVLSTAATLSISNSPGAGTNATITRSYSLMSENGNVCFTMSSNAGLTVDFLGANTAGNSRTVTFKSALGGSSANTDYIFNTATARTAGNLFTISNNGVARLTVAYNGNVNLSQAASTASSPVLMTIQGGAHTALTASTEAVDINILLARTVEFSTGGIGLQRAISINAPTYGFVGASTITSTSLLSLNGAPACGTNATFTNTYILSVGGNTTLTSVSGLTYSAINVGSHTVTITGTTSMTSGKGVAGISIGQITYSDASAATLTNASSLYIANAPSGGGAGPLTITNAYAIFVDNGVTRLDGSVYMGKGADIASAGDLVLGKDGNTFGITGTTTINAIGTGNITAGTVIHLIFAGALTVKHNTAGGGGTAKIFLNLSLDLTTAANTVLTLVYDGTQFQEVCRKIA